MFRWGTKEQSKERAQALERELGRAFALRYTGRWEARVAGREAAICHGHGSFATLVSVSSPCEGLTDFRGEDIFPAERPGYERNIWVSGQSYSQGVLDTCSASGSPWQRCLQEIMVSWSGPRQVHVE